MAPVIELEDNRGTVEQGTNNNGKCTEGDVVGPWTCARAAFKVIAPEKSRKQRRKNLQMMKNVASEGLNSTPYVKINWADKEEQEEPALFDTGAQWSLISAHLLSEEEITAMQLPSLAGRGVSGEKIPVIGEIWRSLWVGGLLFKKQRFIVVERMICPIILGIDFWSRVSGLSFDFNRGVLMISGSTQEIRLLHHPSAEGVANVDGEDSANEEEHWFEVTVDGDVTVPPRSESNIPCLIKGAEEGKEYMVQPITSDDKLVNTPYGIVKAGENGKVILRIANMSTDEALLKEGEQVAIVEDTAVWVANPVAGKAFKPKSGAMGDTDVRELICSKLEANKRAQLTGLLLKHNEIFYKGGKLPIVQVGVEHSIRTQVDSQPVASKPRRLSKELADEVRGHIAELLEQGVIRESDSQWASPIVCARKKDGTLRMAIDYRMVNERSNTATLHPIPLIDDLLDRLGKAKYFAVLDAKAGYHQLPLNKDDSDKTAFVVPGGHYEFAGRTPFGLKGAGYSFQRMMSVVLGCSNFVDALCYLDDILVWGETWEVFMKRLRKVLEKIKSSGLSLAAKKCQFGVREVSYLGCTIKEGMVKINEQRVQQLRQIERPRNVRELRRALGAFGYVQRWLPGLAQVARPLYSAVTNQPYARLHWDEEMDSAFVIIKDMIADAVALRLPDMEKPFTLVTDCSQVAAGAMLAQVDTSSPNLLKPTAFYHYALSKAEQNYSATEKELLAMVKAIKKFRVYLGRKFELITDHKALSWLKSLNPENETGRRGRWLDLIQQFDMVVIHKKGKSPEMRIADYLSRVKCDGDIVSGNDDEDTRTFLTMAAGDKESVNLSKDMILEEQQRNASIRSVKAAITEGRDLNPGGSESDSWRKPSFISGDKELEAMWRHRDRLFVDKEGILRLSFNGGRRTQEHPYGTIQKNRVVVPETLRVDVLKLVHRSPTAAHMGNTRSWKRMRDNFWWPHMREDLEEFIRKCEECSVNKHMNKPNKAPVAKTSLPGKPLDELMVDFLGPFQAAQRHPFRYVLQIQDVFSRFLIFVACVDAKAKTAAEQVMNRWLCLFGMPKSMRSDRGPHFVADVFEELCNLTGIKHKLGSPEHPQSQAQVERQNQLLNQVRCICENDIEKWPDALYKVQCSHNAAINATTGFSPARLLLGKDFNLPEDLITQENHTNPQTPLTVIEEREEENRLAIQLAKTNMDIYQNKRVEEAQEIGNPNPIPYTVGDTVRYKLNDDVRSRSGGKMAPRYSEPYRVMDVKGDGFTYTLEPMDSNSKGMIKDRRFNYLRTVSRLNEELEQQDTELMDNGHPENQSSEISSGTGKPAIKLVTPTRQSTRNKKPVLRLQVGGKCKRYEESQALNPELEEQ